MLPRYDLPAEGLAGPGSVAWKINGEIVLLAGWGRAVLLEFAHPLVAAGVAHHSVFVNDPARARERLVSTISAMLALTFGTGAEAARAARGINAIHDRVHGHLDEDTGALRRGTSYSAHDPELLRWVHATLMESFPLTHRLFVGPLTDEEVERYLEEAAGLEPLLGIPDGFLPRTRQDLAEYVERMYGAGAIRVGPTARRLAHQLLHPPVPWPLRPLAAPVLWVARLPAIGLLPPEIRAQYGFRWTRAHALALRTVSLVSRAILPRVPALLRRWPVARHAERRHTRTSEVPASPLGRGRRRRVRAA